MRPTQSLTRIFIVLVTTIAFTFTCVAQEIHIVPARQYLASQASTPAQNSAGATASDQAQAPKTITLPAGTVIAMVVTRTVRINDIRSGDTIYLQTSFPVTVGNRVVIPPGTYVQGVIEKIKHRDKSHRVISFSMNTGNLIFNNGYTVSLGGIQDVAPTVARVNPPPSTPSQPGSNTGSVPVLAATGTPGLPPLPPLPPFGNGPRNAIIGLGVGAAAVAVLGIALAGRRSSSEALMHAGTPLEMLLQNPVELDEVQIEASIKQYSGQMKNQPPNIPNPPASAISQMGTCYTPGTPGTPDTINPGTPPTVIPGTPATPNSPGTPDTVIPGTPPTIIPGTPGTPGTSYPCPRHP
jgi:hypothetical protein